jgi:endonuclease-3
MNLKQEKANYISDRLQELYPNPPMPLDHTDAYTLLIAVLLSAQCTDIRVNKTTPILFKMASTPQEMVKHSVQEIQNIIRPCGLSPAKASAIHRLSQILLDKHNGVVPGNFEDLEELPGVGHKTASVVMSHIFNVPAFPVDTHIHRLAQRWGLTNGKNVTQTEADLKKVFAKERWNKLHLQIIYYGREYCTASSCDGLQCEICAAVNFDRKKPVITKK